VARQSQNSKWSKVPGQGGLQRSLDRRPRRNGRANQCSPSAAPCPVAVPQALTAEVLVSAHRYTHAYTHTLTESICIHHIGRHATQIHTRALRDTHTHTQKHSCVQRDKLHMYTCRSGRDTLSVPIQRDTHVTLVHTRITPEMLAHPVRHTDVHLPTASHRWEGPQPVSPSAAGETPLPGKALDQEGPRCIPKQPFTHPQTLKSGPRPPGPCPHLPPGTTPATLAFPRSQDPGFLLLRCIPASGWSDLLRSHFKNPLPWLASPCTSCLSHHSGYNPDGPFCSLGDSTWVGRHSVGWGLASMSCLQETLAGRRGSLAHSHSQRVTGRACPMEPWAAQSDL
jgi:hypothetical protein